MCLVHSGSRVEGGGWRVDGRCTPAGVCSKGSTPLPGLDTPFAADDALLDGGDKLKVGWLGWVPREQKMLKGQLPRVKYHQVY